MQNLNLNSRITTRVTETKRLVALEKSFKEKLSHLLRVLPVNIYSWYRAHKAQEGSDEYFREWRTDHTDAFCDTAVALFDDIYLGYLGKENLRYKLKLFEETLHLHNALSSFKCGRRTVGEAHIIWLNKGTFIDVKPGATSFIDRGSIPINQLSGCTIDVRDHRAGKYQLQWLYSSWFSRAISEEEKLLASQKSSVRLLEIRLESLKESYEKTALRRERYKQRKQTEKARSYISHVRRNPGKQLDLFHQALSPLSALSEFTGVTPKRNNTKLGASATEAIWSLILEYKHKPRSRFHSHVISSDPKINISRAAVRHRNKKIAQAGRELDYIFRAFGGMTQMRELLIDLIKDKRITNKGLRPVLTSMMPAGNELRDPVRYCRFTHDLYYALSQLKEFINSKECYASFIFNDLQNSIQTRSLGSFQRNINRVESIPDNVLKRIIGMRRVTSLDGLKVLCDKEAKAEEIAGIHRVIANHNLDAAFIDKERFIDNMTNLGVLSRVENYLTLFNGHSKGHFNDLTLPPYKGIDVSRTDIRIEITNIAMIDSATAMALPSICIPFSGQSHMKQLDTNSGYISVYFKGMCAISGYLVDVGEYILLNNLQGSGYRSVMSRHRQVICEAMIALLRSLPKSTMFIEHYYNSLPLASTLEDRDIENKQVNFELPAAPIDCKSGWSYNIIESDFVKKEAPEQLNSDTATPVTH